MISDSKMYPWFAFNDYLCFRIDLQGSGDSEGVLTDEYTDEELTYSGQVIAEIAALPSCDGNVGMMGKSWSAINSLMVAARPDRPRSLNAVLVCCGSDDHYNDDVHYMGGAMMFDNVSWPSSMFGWLALPPDPAVVGDPWKEMWRERIRNADFWFKQWATHQPRGDYENSVRGHFEDVQVPVFVMSGWQDGYKNPAERVVAGLSALGKPVQGLLGPWGHKYPFGGYRGPRIPWLQYTVTHWWDKWLKGKAPSPATDWPELSVWLSESQGPSKSLCPDEKGKWVAEDKRLAFAGEGTGALSRSRQSPARCARQGGLFQRQASRPRHRDAGDATMTTSPASGRAPTRRRFISIASRWPTISIFSATHCGADAFRQPADGVVVDTAQRDRAGDRRLASRHLSLLQSCLSQRRHGEP